MTFKLGNGVREYTGTTGTGSPLALLGAVAPNNKTFLAGIGASNTTVYRVLSSDGVTWEEGIGTVSSDGTTISRDTIIDTNAGGSTPVSLSGTSRIWCVIPADWSQLQMNMDALTIQGNAVATEANLSAILDAAVSTAQGALITRGASGWQVLLPSSREGTVLASGGTGANLSYALAGGASWHAAVNVATTGALAANTYANGTAGVGATLTATADAALTIDGVAMVVGYRVLVKDEAAVANNGIYVVTQVGDGTHPYILTRASDYDTPGAIFEGDGVMVGAAGTTNGRTLWTMFTASTSIVIGTSDINWSLIGIRNSEGLDIIGATEGDILIRGATGWEVLAIGSTGQVLTVNAGLPAWETGGGGGSVLFADLVDEGAWSGSSSYAAGSVVEEAGGRFLATAAIGTPPTPVVGWNATYGSTNWTISGTNNDDAAWTTQPSAIIANQGTPSGLIYFEIQPPNMGVYSGELAGFAVAGHSLTAMLGSNADSVGLDSTIGGLLWNFNGTTHASGMSRITSGNWLGFAVNIDTQEVWVRDVSGAPTVWFGNGGSSPDPVAGVNGFSFAGMTSGPIFPAASDHGDGAGTFVLNIGETSFVHTVPTGFSSVYAAGGSHPSPVVDTTNWLELDSGSGSGVTSAQLDTLIGSTRGTMLARGASGWGAVAPGTLGQVLTMDSSGDPAFATPSGGGGGGSGLFNQVMSTTPTLTSTGLDGTHLLGTGTPAIANGATGVVISAATGGFGAYKTAPSTPYTVKALMTAGKSSLNCFGFTDGAGKIQAMYQDPSNSNLIVVNYSDINTYAGSSPATVGGYPTANALLWLRIRNDGTLVYFDHSTDGDTWDNIYQIGSVTVGVAVDLAAGKIWGRVNAGSWGPSGDPAAGTGGNSMSSLSGALFPGFSTYNGSQATANFGATTFKNAAPSGFSAWDAAATFNPSDKNTNITLSNGNLTAVGVANGSWKTVRGTSSHVTTGKYYFEFSADDVDTSNGWMIGLANASASLSSYLGNDGNSCCYQSDQHYYIGGGSSSGQLLSAVTAGGYLAASGAGYNDIFVGSLAGGGTNGRVTILSYAET